MKMKVFRTFNSPQIERLLSSGAVGCIPTDTLYGLSVSASNKDALERLYELRGRDAAKPFIVLIDSVEALKKFKIRLTKSQHALLEVLWPGKASVVLACPTKLFPFLHRGTGSLAFRVPDYTPLRKLLSKTGPLVSTSVNREGKKPATTIIEAQAFFKDSLDFSIDVGRRVSAPSTLVSLLHAKPVILRQGAVHVFLNE